MRARLQRRSTMIAAVAAGALLAGCATHTVPPISADRLAAARLFKSYTVYWAGTVVDGVPLTQADSPLYFYAAVGYSMYYGNCEGRGTLHDGGCNLPLRIPTSVYETHSDSSFGPQTWVEFHGVPAVIYNGGDSIELYTDRMDVDIAANTPARALAAARALRPFNRVPTPDFPAFPQPYYTPNPLPPPTGPTTGATSVIGASSDITPPSTLEPTPSVNGP